MHEITDDPRSTQHASYRAHAFWHVVTVSLCAVVQLALVASFLAWFVPSAPIVASELVYPDIDPHNPITVRAQQGISTSVGNYAVHQLVGDCRIEQGSFVGRADRLTLWVDKDSTYGQDNPVRVLVQLQDNVEVAWNANDRMKTGMWNTRMFSYFAPEILADGPVTGSLAKPIFPWNIDEAAYNQQLIASNSFVQPAQFTLDGAPTTADNNFERLDAPVGGIVLDEQGNIISTPRSSNPASPTEQVEAFQLPTPPISTQAETIVPGAIPQSLGSAIGANPTFAPNPTTGTLPVQSAPQKVGADSFLMTGRNGSAANVQFINDAARSETVVVISNGVLLQFANVAVNSGSSTEQLGTVRLEADRAVIWTTDHQRMLAGNVQGQPVEVYLEGNVVFQQGRRIVYADRMYYNAQAEIGTILNAEILTPVPQYEGILRLKSDVVQQRSRQNFVAYDAAFTSSRMGVPRYWLQSDRLELTDTRDSADPNQFQNAQRTGTTNMEATARNNFIYIDGIPIAYWPSFTSNVDTPSFYLRSIKFKNDRIFGQQVYVDTDLHQLLGIDAPDGTDWRLSTDYLSKRGFALGTNYRYNLPSFIFDGPATGQLDVWGLNDDGLDILGRDRVLLTPEETTRGRVFLQHRQNLSRDLEFRAEVGYITDRNFLEQFFEREWDQNKDQSTTLRLRRFNENRMLDLWGQVRLNDFFTETEWLPRLDYYMLGQPLFDRFTYYSFSHAGYAKLKTATTPTDPADAATFQLLPWEVPSEGIRAGTRQELAMPLDAGPFKIVPYINGEAMYYGEDLTGDSLTRLTGQTGVRSTLPMWRTYENAQSRIFNVNGIAHKANFNTEFFYADSSANLDQIPLYDQLDDNAQEHFQRRLIFNTFGGVLPDQFDSRSYAVRQGLQRYVTANSQDVVEDQMQVRVGLDQRWQTKRGLPGRERITDLVEFDVAAILFPKSDRDNFGETVGGVNFDGRIHLGDRVSLLSDGYADLFDNGLKVLSAGAMISRPGRGQWYVGVTRLTGPINSTVLNSNINYLLNEKYILTGGSIVDLGEAGNVGQSIGLTRVGESFLTQVGINVDSGRDNAVFFFNFEPRFLSIRGLGAVGGKLIPPAGTYGLE